ncbi:hypothetical protein BJ508DRAFT_69294 [Ascobolus immersus RN42]|uniref:CFEM domain-containing protein n=1 Tax=Ascobolus immersus RN42 TaxID=1160509 RepID=A0A3N4HEK2_ASCIM|nr:hypothetical protein BJ508DRAFT_69294 [Ascobolus immersus RN42]
MNRRTLLITIQFLAIPSVIHAQGTPGLPTCAVECLRAGLETANCGADVGCACAKESFVRTAASCMRFSCEKQDVSRSIEGIVSLCRPFGVDVLINLLFPVASDDESSSGSTGDTKTSGFASTSSAVSNSASPTSTSELQPDPNRTLTNNSSGGKGSSKTLALGLGISLGLLFIAIIILILFLLKRRRDKQVPISEHDQEAKSDSQAPAAFLDTQTAMGTGYAYGDLSEGKVSVKELDNCEILEAPDTEKKPPAELNSESELPADIMPVGVALSQ